MYPVALRALSLEAIGGLLLLGPGDRDRDIDSGVKYAAVPGVDELAVGLGDLVSFHDVEDMSCISESGQKFHLPR